MSISAAWLNRLLAIPGVSDGPKMDLEESERTRTAKIHQKQNRKVRGHFKTRKGTLGIGRKPGNLKI